MRRKVKNKIWETHAIYKIALELKIDHMPIKFKLSAQKVTFQDAVTSLYVGQKVKQCYSVTRWKGIFNSSQEKKMPECKAIADKMGRTCRDSTLV